MKIFYAVRQLVLIAVVCSHRACALPVGYDAGAVTGGAGLLGRLNPLQIPAYPLQPAVAMQPTQDFNAGQPSVGGLLGRGKNAVVSLYRPAPGLPANSAAVPALVAANEPENGASGTDEEESHDEVVARYDQLADAETNPLWAAYMRVKGRVLAPRREVEECPSGLCRFCEENLWGAKLRQGSEDYPSYARRGMEALHMNVPAYFPA